MQDTSSNLVYVVSLGMGPIAGTLGLSTIDVLRRYNLYFCPVGGMNPGGWPRSRRTTSASASAGASNR